MDKISLAKPESRKGKYDYKKKKPMSSGWKFSEEKRHKRKKKKQIREQKNCDKTH